MVWQQRLRERRGLEHRLHHGQAVLRQQRGEGHLGRDRLRQPGRPIPRPVGHQQQDGGPCQVLDKCGEPGFGRGVDPMEVLDRKDEGLAPTVVQHEVPQQRKGPGLPLLGAESEPAASSSTGTSRSWSSRGISSSAMSWASSRYCRTFAVMTSTPSASVMPHALAEQVTHRQIGDGAAVRKAVPFPVGHRLPRQAPAEFREQAGLPHARLPHNPHHLAMPLRHMRQTFVQEGHFALAPHKATPVAPCRCPDTPARRCVRPCTYRRGWAPPARRQDEVRSDLDLDLLLHQSVGRCTHEHRPGRRQVLQPEGLVHGVTNRRIELSQRRRETADDHWSRVHPHPRAWTSPKGCRRRCWASSRAASTARRA